jgi:hypothetical protein
MRQGVRCGSCRSDERTGPAGGRAEEGIFVSARMPLRRHRRPGRLPDPEGLRPSRAAEGIAGAEPLSGKPTRSGRRVCRSALQFRRDVAAASPHDRLGPPAGTANRVDWPTFGLAVLGRITAGGLAGAEGRSHLQVQAGDGNACLEWLPIAFPFAEGPRVRIRLPPAASHTNPTRETLRPAAGCGGQPPSPHTHWRTRS